ncbi:uncharacterized protein PHALS_07764 [Plasmopara halstedii]|uniref:Uncharacterized protein n=1 Tax=Plasmopara halstedii TaxID=4781 RepID=A0A0P1B6C5_PLAHL|nr:uncharacterized protein PHALS_07764 [Plasmopara halstedii]CEG50034.1 hypothetical protein PHALS_07764 [Plasmopara halstedii]|eukprot:XP_024586403.1 hypothetical protein PHALS_07764 [Plasmopara halstedii]
MVAVRFSASKVALVTGLHDYGDVTEELLNCVYQDREELLKRDANRLQLRIVSKDQELELLVRKSGAAVASKLRAALCWSKEKSSPARVAVAQQLLTDINKRLAEAQKADKLAKAEVREVRKLLVEKINTSVGTRNELLALRAYERQIGSKVRLTNEHFYFLTFPFPPKTNRTYDANEETCMDYVLLAGQGQRSMTVKRPSRRAHSSTKETLTNKEVNEFSKDGLFSICGMVDGVADVLTISSEDEWGLTPVVVEIKNRMRGFRSPLPLYDQVQLAVYMKMLGVEHGDLVQCIYGANHQPSIQVSRVSLNVAPLHLSASSTQKELDLWAEVIVPRLYAFTATVQKLRDNELLRLSFLNGTGEERRALLRVECYYL